MIYKTFQDKKLSALGMGCMRLPMCGPAATDIDVPATREMVAYAMAHGINYYDTAWGYHDGASETVMGEVLSEYPRDTFYLASKFPGYDLANMPHVKEIFEKQLEKCRVDYFDFYLFHNLCELNVDAYLDPRYGIYDYLMEQKRLGRIRHLGVSGHGSYETMKRFLDAYGDDMEFCQLQVNWLDWEFQDAWKKVELVTSYGIPVWVMEPLRGGALVKPGAQYEEKLLSLRPGVGCAELAFRFLQSIPSVTVTLSGMSNFEQMKQNIAIFETEAPLTEAECETLFAIAREKTRLNTLPCTGCRYCTTHCPMELNIPRMIELYNEHIYSGGGFIAPMAMSALPEDKWPSACLGCGACEAVCPQNIKISDMMADFAAKLK